MAHKARDSLTDMELSSFCGISRPISRTLKVNPAQVTRFDDHDVSKSERDDALNQAASKYTETKFESNATLAHHTYRWMNFLYRRSGDDKEEGTRDFPQFVHHAHSTLAPSEKNPDGPNILEKSTSSKGWNIKKRQVQATHETSYSNRRRHPRARFG
jgi:hypothetical protein